MDAIPIPFRPTPGAEPRQLAEQLLRLLDAQRTGLAITVDEVHGATVTSCRSWQLLFSISSMPDCRWHCIWIQGWTCEVVDVLRAAGIDNQRLEVAFESLEEHGPDELDPDQAQ